MLRKQVSRRLGFAVLVSTPLLALIGLTGTASGYPVQYCKQIPIVYGSRERRCRRADAVCHRFLVWSPRFVAELSF